MSVTSPSSSGEREQYDKVFSDVRFEDTGLSSRLTANLYSIRQLPPPLSRIQQQTYDNQLGHVQFTAYSNAHDRQYSTGTFCVF